MEANTNDERQMRLLENDQVTQLMIDSGLTTLGGEHYAFARAVEDAVIRSYTNVAMQFAMRMDRGAASSGLTYAQCKEIAQQFNLAGAHVVDCIIKAAGMAGSQVLPESALPSRRLESVQPWQQRAGYAPDAPIHPVGHIETAMAAEISDWRAQADEVGDAQRFQQAITSEDAALSLLEAVRRNVPDAAGIRGDFDGDVAAIIKRTTAAVPEGGAA